jgi:lipoprotein-anchoring transpeptidase ErfK/SrfK
MLRALRGGRSDVELRTVAVKPSVTEDDLGFTIVVRTSTNRLYLYDGFDLRKSYVVATGQPQYPTPLGHFEIINKRINPTWINPALDTWGKDEPAMIPPGPDNPLGTRALDLDAPGIRIHGTPDDASIGLHASHGCIRMHIPDSEDLFGRVPVGTRVIITT